MESDLAFFGGSPSHVAAFLSCFDLLLSRTCRNHCRRILHRRRLSLLSFADLALLSCSQKQKNDLSCAENWKLLNYWKINVKTELVVKRTSNSISGWIFLLISQPKIFNVFHWISCCEEEGVLNFWLIQKVWRIYSDISKYNPAKIISSRNEGKNQQHGDQTTQQQSIKIMSSSKSSVVSYNST